MKVEPFEAVQASGPIIEITSTRDCVYFTTPSQVFTACSKREVDKVSAWSFQAVATDGNNKWFVVADREGVVRLLDRRKQRWLAPIQIARADDIRKVHIKDDCLLLAVDRFVVCLNIGVIVDSLVDMGPNVSPQPLQSEWGKMHALHSDTVTALALTEDDRLVVSGGQDGLVCCARVRVMDPLDAHALLQPKSYSDETVESDDNIMAMCIGLGQSVRSFCVIEDLLLVLCDLHQIALYQLGCLIEEGSEQFNQILSPSLQAYELACTHLQQSLKSPTHTEATEPDDSMSESTQYTCQPGIIDPVCFLKVHKKNIQLLVTHSQGKSCLLHLDPKTGNAQFNTLVRGVDND